VTGSSGHLGGGLLLAAILGPYPALLTLTSVLIIQALLFADGGLLALGCNIFNMGVISCLIAYPLIYRPLLRKSITPRRLMTVSILTAVISMQLGSFAVVAETTASGITELPFTSFLALMQPIHLAIGSVEGVVTGAVLCFIYRVRGDIIETALGNDPHTKLPVKKILILFTAAALITGGFLSIYASVRPDGLEWSVTKVTDHKDIKNASDTQTVTGQVQKQTAILPDYSFRGEKKDNRLGTTVAGVTGAAITLAVTCVLGLIILKIKKNKRRKTEPEQTEV
jgi:cobalt/nickel transport system permease protein